jgi:multidrug transporter EmrE-like cation transporter
MKLAEFWLVLTGVLLNAIAQLLLKAGANRLGMLEFAPERLIQQGLALATNLPILGGLACYAISVIVWITALTKVEVSVAYPMLSIGYVVNAALAWYLFGEAVTPMRLIGIAIIIVGVVIVVRS